MQLFTTGYEGETLAAFLRRLVDEGVEVVADVREAPVSRKAGFSKAALAEALRGAGIGYRHIRELGCPKAIRDQHRADHDWERYTRLFLAHLDQQAAALDALAALSLEQRTAVLCYEADYNHCHRMYVARAVARSTGAEVCHITAAGLVKESRALGERVGLDAG